MKQINANKNKNHSRVSLSGIPTLFKMKAAETPDTNARGWHHAFTLIELLVVVLIIGILSAIALPQYQRAVEKARAAEAFVIIRAIADANRRYYLANGEYTWSLTDLDIEVPGDSIIDSGEMDRNQTKYFLYGARSSSKDDTSGIIALASRLPVRQVYALAIFSSSDAVYCKGYSEKGFSLCRMLGVKESVYNNNYNPIDL